MSAYTIHSSLQDSFLPAEEPYPVSTPKVLKVNTGQSATANWDDFEDTEPAYDVEDIDDRVNEVQQQLKRLREEQEAVQLLNSKKAEFQEGRTDIVEKLTCASTEFEHEARALQLRADAMEEASQSFRRHLAAVERIRPEDWPRKDVHAGLDQALEVISEASIEFESETRRVEALGGSATANPTRKKSGKAGVVGSILGSNSEQSFFYWMRSGFAFTLPVIVLGLIALILILAALGGSDPAAATAIQETTSTSSL
ncbi:MAG: hypothetical protein ACI8UO_002785 [Verrucomicrobiales bacterium]|jgi:hypothetical protein